MQKGKQAARTILDTWRRLNGLPPSCDLEPMPRGLPRPSSTTAQQEEKKLALLLKARDGWGDGKPG